MPQAGHQEIDAGEGDEAVPAQGAGMDTAVATEAILQRMEKTKSNAEFLEGLTDM